jgi:hypothetical protein
VYADTCRRTLSVAVSPPGGCSVRSSLSPGVVPRARRFCPSCPLSGLSSRPASATGASERARRMSGAPADGAAAAASSASSASSSSSSSLHAASSKKRTSLSLGPDEHNSPKKLKAEPAPAADASSAAREAAADSAMPDVDEHRPDLPKLPSALTGVSSATAAAAAAAAASAAATKKPPRLSQAQLTALRSGLREYATVRSAFFERLDDIVGWWNPPLPVPEREALREQLRLRHPTFLPLSAHEHLEIGLVPAAFHETLSAIEAVVCAIDVPQRTAEHRQLLACSEALRISANAFVCKLQSGRVSIDGVPLPVDLHTLADMDRMVAHSQETLLAGVHFSTAVDHHRWDPQNPYGIIGRAPGGNVLKDVPVEEQAKGHGYQVHVYASEDAQAVRFRFHVRELRPIDLMLRIVSFYPGRVGGIILAHADMQPLDLTFDEALRHPERIQGVAMHEWNSVMQLPTGWTRRRKQVMSVLIRPAAAVPGPARSLSQSQPALSLHSLASLPGSKVRLNTDVWSPTSRWVGADSLLVCHVAGAKLFSASFCRIVRDTLHAPSTAGCWKDASVRLELRRFNQQAVPALPPAWGVNLAAVARHKMLQQSAADMELWTSIDSEANQTSVAAQHLRQMLDIPSAVHPAGAAAASAASAAASSVSPANPSSLARPKVVENHLILWQSSVWDTQAWAKLLIKMLVDHPIGVVELRDDATGGVIALTMVLVGVERDPHETPTLEQLASQQLERGFSTNSLQQEAQEVPHPNIRNVKDHPFENRHCDPSARLLQAKLEAKEYHNDAISLMLDSPGCAYITPLLLLMRGLKPLSEQLGRLSAPQMSAAAAARLRESGMWAAHVLLHTLLQKSEPIEPWASNSYEALPSFHGSILESLFPAPMSAVSQISPAVDWLVRVLDELSRADPCFSILTSSSRPSSTEQHRLLSVIQLQQSPCDQRSAVDCRVANSSVQATDSVKRPDTTQSMVAAHFRGLTGGERILITHLPEVIWVGVQRGACERQRATAADATEEKSPESDAPRMCDKDSCICLHPAHERISQVLDWKLMHDEAARDQLPPLLSPDVLEELPLQYDLHAILTQNLRNCYTGYQRSAGSSAPTPDDWIMMPQPVDISKTEPEERSQEMDQAHITVQLSQEIANSMRTPDDFMETPVLLCYVQRSIASLPIAPTLGQRRSSTLAAAAAAASCSADTSASNPAASASSSLFTPLPTPIHCSQRDTATDVLRLLRGIINEYIQSKKDVDDQFVITGMDWFVVVPRYNTIRNQTLIRLKDAMGLTQLESQAHIAPPDLAQQRTKVLDNGDEMKPRVQEFLDRASANPSMLFFLINDEAHWGAGFGSAKNILELKAAHIPNLFVIGSTATPYVIEALIPTVVRWTHWDRPSPLIALIQRGQIKKVTPTEQETRNSQRYWGMDAFAADETTRNALDDYISTVRMHHQNSDVLGAFANYELAEQPAGSSNKEKPVLANEMEAFSVLMDYAHALVMEYRRLVGAGDISSAERVSSRAAREVMRDLIAKPDLSLGSSGHAGPLCVVRFARVANVRLFAQQMRRIRDALKLQYAFEIFVDVSGDGKLDDGIVGSPGGVGRFWKRKAGVLQSDLSTQKLTYRDLTGMPCLLLLNAKCAMGDTLPANFRHYDLRAKYCGDKIPTRTAFEQDAGRANGYSRLFSERPKLLVHEVALKCMVSMAARTAQSLMVSMPARTAHSLMKPSGDYTTEAAGHTYQASEHAAAKDKLFEKGLRKKMALSPGQVTRQRDEDDDDESGTKFVTASTGADSDDIPDDDDDDDDDSESVESDTSEGRAHAAVLAAEECQLDRDMKRAKQAEKARLNAYTRLLPLFQAHDEKGGYARRQAMFKRIVLIVALPQLGKTGCYVYAICKLLEEYSKESLQQLKHERETAALRAAEAEFRPEASRRKWKCASMECQEEMETPMASQPKQCPYCSRAYPIIAPPAAPSEATPMEIDQ